jgi:hypothetical protein
MKYTYQPYTPARCISPEAFRLTLLDRLSSGPVADRPYVEWLISTDRGPAVWDEGTIHRGSWLAYKWESFWLHAGSHIRWAIPFDLRRYDEEVLPIVVRGHDKNDPSGWSYDDGRDPVGVAVCFLRTLPLQALTATAAAPFD